MQEPPAFAKELLLRQTRTAKTFYANARYINTNVRSLLLRNSRPSLAPIAVFFSNNDILDPYQRMICSRIIEDTKRFNSFFLTLKKTCIG